MPIDPTAGATLLVTAHPGPQTGRLAGMGAVPVRTIDPDTPIGRLAAIMAGRSDALLADQGRMATALPLPAPEPGDTGENHHLAQQGTETTQMQTQDAPDTMEVPALLDREDFLDRMADRTSEYIRHGKESPARRRGRTQARTQERTKQPCATADKQ